MADTSQWLLVLVALLSTVVVVQHGLVYCNLSCEERISGETPNGFRLQVNASVTDNAITITCSVTEIPSKYLSSANYITLRLTENHKALLGPHYTVDNSAGNSVTVTIHNHTNADYGVYTCQCYNDFTQQDIEEIYHDDIVFHRHCSDPVSIEVVPLSGNLKVTRHLVQNKSEIVSLNCTTTNSDLLYTVDDPDNIDYFGQPSHEVEIISAFDQKKYICVNNQSTLTEIHYISIKDYQPPEFMYPPPDSDETIIDEPTSLNVPACAVYSSLPMVLFDYSAFYEFPLEEVNYNVKVKNVDLFVNVIPKLVINFSEFDICIFETQWETITLFFELHITSGGPTIVPSICLFMSVDPPSDSIIYTDSFTITCSLYTTSDITGSKMELTDSNNSTHALSLSERDPNLHDVTNYPHVFVSATEKNAGEYSCLFSWNEIQKTASLSIPLITKPQLPTYTSSPSPNVPSSVMISSLSIYTSTPSMDPATTPTSSVSPSMTLFTDHSPSPFASSDGVQPLLYGVIVGCSLLIVTIVMATLATFLLLYCYHKHQRKSKVEAAAASRSPEHQLGDMTMPIEDLELDRVSVWSLSSLTENNVHHEKKISENMRKCVHQLIVSNWYIPCDKLLFCEGLGSGAFGKVKRAEIFGINNSNTISSVAVKMLKDDSNEEAEKGIITEFNVLQNVGSHEHLVSLLGASLHNGKLSLVVEFCSGGDLLKYLRKKGNEKMAADLTMSQQMDMGRQIACGMEYLASKKCVHRDLAARNILITEDGTLKVSDFGLARETYHSMYQMTTKGKIPFKWMAPESVFYQVYTTKSDIWSFGVLLWEIVTFGCSPYPGKSVEEVLKDLQKEKLMERPDNCPVEVFNLILTCWKFEASERASFTTLKHNLTNLKFEEKQVVAIKPIQLTSNTSTSSSLTTDGGYISSNSSSSPAPHAPLFCTL